MSAIQCNVCTDAVVPYIVDRFFQEPAWNQNDVTMTVLLNSKYDVCNGGEDENYKNMGFAFGVDPPPKAPVWSDDWIIDGSGDGARLRRASAAQGSLRKGMRENFVKYEQKMQDGDEKLFKEHTQIDRERTTFIQICEKKIRADLEADAILASIKTCSKQRRGLDNKCIVEASRQGSCSHVCAGRGGRTEL